MGKYTLKEGVVLHPHGLRTRVDNSNLTDELAQHLIKKGQAKKEQFNIKK